MGIGGGRAREVNITGSGLIRAGVTRHSSALQAHDNAIYYTVANATRQIFLSVLRVGWGVAEGCSPPRVGVVSGNGGYRGGSFRVGGRGDNNSP